MTSNLVNICFEQDSKIPNAQSPLTLQPPSQPLPTPSIQQQNHLIFNRLYFKN